MFSILQKPKDAVNAEDLETLQNEIEKSLIDVVTQRWQLERELIVLNSTSPEIGDQPSSNSSQTYMNAGDARNSLYSAPKRPPHSKQRSTIVPAKSRNSPHESHTKNKKHIQRNEAPDKLWPFVEQFCATPTEDQIEELDQLIKSVENSNEYFKIPTPGKKDCSPKDSRKKSKTRPGDEESGLGALTQRLVSSFIEVSESPEISPEETPMNKRKKAKTSECVGVNNVRNLEERIRYELEECNILDEHDEIPYTSEEDEVLRELIASQHELLTIQRQNKTCMQKLLDRAKLHRELMASREKLSEANADVVAAYRRLISARQRKRIPGKKEVDAACKALKIHGAIFKECDELYMSSLGGDD